MASDIFRKKLLYSYREATELLSISVNTLRNLIDEGQIERVYIAKKEPRITGESIFKYVDKMKRENGSLQHL